MWEVFGVGTQLNELIQWSPDMTKDLRGGGSLFVEIRYRHEACAVCHQGALSLLLATKMLIHVPACNNPPLPVCFM